jgi:nicotinamide mononucleotide transporter
MVWLEYFGVITGLLYLFLEIKQHKAMWVVGFLTSLVYVFVFLSAKIYADMGLQTYYVGISIYRILYTHLSLPLFVGIIGTLAVVFAILWYLLHQFTDSPIPVGDAFTTSVGIVATWMLARRIIEHWIFWVIVNLVSVYLYYLRGLYPTMLLYFCYATLAIVGYYNWRKKGEEF